MERNEQRRDEHVNSENEAPGADAGTGASDEASAPRAVGGDPARPDVERDQSGLGSESASGRTGWQGADPSQSETGTMGRGDTGSLGSAGPADAQWQGGQPGRAGHPAAETGGAQGQGVVGGETFEGRARDVGQGGWTQDDSGRAGGDDEADASGSGDARTDLS